MSRWRTSLPVLLAAVLIGPPAVAQSWTFTRIVGQGDPMPGSDAAFDEFSSVALEDHVVAFFGEEQEGVERVQGIFTNASGVLALAVDTSTRHPETNEPFFSIIQAVHVFDGRIFFQAVRSGPNEGVEPGAHGYYASDDGVVTTLVEVGDSIPGGDEWLTFISFAPYRATAHGLAFEGEGAESQEGVFAVDASGALVTIAQRLDPTPDGNGVLYQFRSPVMSPQGDVVFKAQRTKPDGHGIYHFVHDTAQLSTVADGSTIIPDGMGGTFTEFFDPWIDGEDIVFVGLEGTYPDDVLGIYASIAGGPLHAVAVQDVTPLPGESNVFVNVAPGSLSIDDGSAAWSGSDSNGSIGIYMQVDGAIARIIGSGDALDGKVIEDFELSRLGRDGTSIAFIASFDDETSAIYVADLDAPCPADVDEDGDVGLPDLLAVLSAWDSPGADLDGDGTTSFADLVIVLAAWGACG